MQFKWTIQRIGDLSYVWQKQTPKVEFSVLENEWKYPNGMVFTLFNDKADLLSIGWINIGDLVEVSRSSKITERNDRKFTNISAYKIEKTQTVQDKMSNNSDRIQWVWPQKQIDNELPF